MRITTTAFAALLFAASLPASAQTTSSCSWIGQVWTCNQAASPQIDWSIPQRSARGFEESIERGREAGRRAAEATLEHDRIQAETELLRAQAGAAQRYQSSPAPVAASAPAEANYFQLWQQAAAPRMHLFTDFDARVYANDVTISNDMVRLMAGSKYAADLAYHFAINQTEARRVAMMSLLDAARAILSVEQTIEAADAE